MKRDRIIALLITILALVVAGTNTYEAYVGMRGLPIFVISLILLLIFVYSLIIHIRKIKVPMEQKMPLWGLFVAMALMVIIYLLK
ncbi:MAG: hypothetical protein AAF242_17180 [Bacteroidota bacterium]